MSYWDTSGLAKIYLPEPDSRDFVQKAATDTAIVVCRLAMHEMRRLAFRKESDGLILAGTAEIVLNQLEQDIAAGQIRVVEIGPQVEVEFKSILVACYRRLPPVPVRTFDALHLATARAEGQAELVTTDKQMRSAATLLGLSLFPK
jgi:predicted nucleic acid-binding protein